MRVLALSIMTIALVGASQAAHAKARFRLLDITKMPMRIEGKGSQRVDGCAASVSASRSAQIMSKKDPIDEAFEKLAGTTTTMGADHHRLAAVCFAPPPNGDIDGPFLFMPGYLIENEGDVLQPLDTVTIPAQTYLVLTYSGPTTEIGDMRSATPLHAPPTKISRSTPINSQNLNRLHNA